MATNIKKETDPRASLKSTTTVTQPEVVSRDDSRSHYGNGVPSGDGVSVDTFNALNHLFQATQNALGAHGVGGTLSLGADGHVYHSLPAVGNVRPQKVDITARTTEALAFFMSAEGGGYTKEQAQGLVANLIAESGLRTDLPGDGGLAMGIAQWHPDRQAKYAALFGVDIRTDNNFRNQLKFVKWELENTEKAAGADLRRQTTAEGAATSLVYKYERPANKVGDSIKRSGIALGLGGEAERVASTTLKSSFGATDKPTIVGAATTAKTAPDLLS